LDFQMRLAILIEAPAVNDFVNDLALTQPAVPATPDQIAADYTAPTQTFIPPPMPTVGIANSLLSTSNRPQLVQRQKRAATIRGMLLVAVALTALGGALIFSLGVLAIRNATDRQTNPGEADSAALVITTPTPNPNNLILVPPGTIDPVSAAATTTSANATRMAASPTPPGLTIQPWNGTSRFTMLLMGIDKRPGEGGTAFRTDTLIILSMDPVSHTAGILSVPRDLFVTIPPNTIVNTNYGLQRINAAYDIGELTKVGSGPTLAMQTVQYNIGIKINAYVVVDFQSVISIINAVGGVDVDVATAINDPQYPSMNYGYDPLYIPAGHIHMDGTLALKYARSRHQSDDLDRARRQQQIVDAVRDKALDVKMVAQLAVQAPTLWNTLSADIHTDLTFDQLVSLALYAKDIPKANVHQGVVDWHYVTGQMYNGMSILVPNRAAMGPLMVQVFGANYNRHYPE
jgi:LCP family protein required for cell wall assembly